MVCRCCSSFKTKNVRDLKEIISTTYFNMLQVKLFIIYHMRKCWAFQLAAGLGSISSRTLLSRPILVQLVQYPIWRNLTVKWVSGTSHCNHINRIFIWSLKYLFMRTSTGVVFDRVYLKLRPSHRRYGGDQFTVKKKVKQSHSRPGQAQRVLRKLRFPDFVTTAQDGGRLSALRTCRLYPQEILLVLISVRG